MAVVQGLTHFMYIAWGRTLERLGIRPDDLDAFQTPVFSVTREMAGRVLSQSPELYALIQAGEDVAPVRAAFLEACGDLSKMADCRRHRWLRRRPSGRRQRTMATRPAQRPGPSASCGSPGKWR